MSATLERPRERTGSLRLPVALHAVDRPSLLIAAVPVLLLLAVSPFYGFDRDELYFLDCARHLQLSYVDQPIFVPLLARLSLQLFGVSLTGLRMWAALAAGGTALVALMTARELGAGRIGQRLAALAVASSPVILGADHIFGPTAFDILAWSSLAWLAVRLGRTGDTRLWLVAGVILGIGEENKHSILFLAVALVVGTLASGGWRLMLNRWFALGAAAALLLATPDLWWQATHGWPTIAMTQRLSSDNGGLANVPTFVLTQLGVTLLALAWLWILGLVQLWRSPSPVWRGLAGAYALLFVFFAVTAGAKPYYLAGAYPYLVAAGSAAVESRLGGAPRRRLLAAGMVVSAALAFPIVLPILPPQDAGFAAAINSVSAETVGWPELVRTVASVWDSLPPSQRARAVIFTSNYGEAGAINELGGSLGLPQAVSGHNTEWWWGPGNPRASTVVAVARGDIGDYGGYLRQFFGDVRQVAVLGNSAGLHNQEQGGAVYVCTRPLTGWGQVWPKLRHYD